MNLEANVGVIVDRVKHLVATVVLLGASAAIAGEQPWQTINTGAIVVKVRDRDDGGKEFWAEGDLKAVGRINEIAYAPGDVTAVTDIRLVPQEA